MPNKYQSGTITISLHEMMLVGCGLYYAIVFGFFRHAMGRLDRSIAWLICASAAEVIMGWFLQAILRRHSPSTFVPQILMVMRAVCRVIALLVILDISIMAALAAYNAYLSQ
jgi:hypothetical protein